MPSASEYAHAFSSPVDYGSIVANTLEQNRRKELEQAQLAQQAEDRDIKRAQLISETLAPLSKDTGTYYDDIMHQKLADFNKYYADEMRKNPKMPLGQQYMLANQYVNNVAQQAKQAKQIQAYAKLLANHQAKDVKGLNEVTLANELEKSAYDNGNIGGDWQDRLAKNAGDLEFTGNHYSLNEAAMKSINDIINKKTTNVLGEDVNVGGKWYEQTKASPEGFKFDYKRGKSVPITEDVEVPITKLNGLTPIQTTEKIPLVPKETLALHIADPDFHHALLYYQNRLQKTDDLAKNMDSETLTRYAGTKLLGDLSPEGSVRDITHSKIREGQEDLLRGLNLNKAQSEKPTEYDATLMQRAINGDVKAIAEYPNFKGVVEGGDGNKIDVRLISQSLPKGIIPKGVQGINEVGVRLYSSPDGSKLYKTEVTTTKGSGHTPDMVNETALKEIKNKKEAENLFLIANPVLGTGKSVITNKGAAKKASTKKEETKPIQQPNAIDRLNASSQSPTSTQQPLRPKGTVARRKFKITTNAR